MSDLFAIHCTTCKTRLQVRDASFVGQIQACPKCGSMVLIEPPPGWAPPKNEPSPPSQSPSGSSAVKKQAKAAPPVPAPVGAASSRATAAIDPASLKETASDSDFNEVDSLLSEKPNSGRAAKAALPPTPGAAPRDTPPQPPPAEAAEEALAASKATASLPPTDWTPDRVKRYRLLGVLTAGGCMGVSLAIGAAFLAASWNDAAHRQQIAGSDEVEEAAQNAPSETLEEPAINDESPTEPAEPAEIKPEETDPRPPDPKPAKVDDPLKLVDDPPPADAKASDDPLNLNDLRRISGLIPDDEGPLPAEGESPLANADIPAPLDEPEAPPSLPRPEPRKIDLKARLADPILEIELADQPLHDVLQMLSNMTTIPITLDPDSLVWSRITPATPVRLRLLNTTVGEVLAELLRPLRLEAVEVGDQLHITRSSAPRTIKSPVDDLTGGDAAKQRQLIEMIELLAAPSTWKSAGGEGTITSDGATLIVTNTELAYGQVLHLCERLRVARGLRPRSVFPPELFAIERRSQRAAKKLALPLTLNFGQPTQLTTILDRFAEETGTHILVDWQAVGEAGWPPDSDATVTLEKTPLGDALTKLIGPMDLTFRVVDANTLQVTTLAALERTPEIEVHPVPDLTPTADEAATLIDRLLPALGDSAVLRYDAPSKSLVALLSQPKHEVLAKLLQEQRPEKPKPQ